MGCGACSKASAVSEEDEVPTTDVLRLLHFGTWLLEDTEHRKHIIFVVLLIFAERRLLDASLLVRFSNAFLRVQQKNSQGTSASRGIAPDVGNLQSIAKTELRAAWKAYLRTKQNEKFYVVKNKQDDAGSVSSLSLEAKAAFRNRARSAVSLVGGLMEREGRTRTDFDELDIDLDSENATTSSFWQASSAVERIASALPLITQTMHSVDAAMKPMLLAVEDIIGHEPLWLPSQVDRCTYQIPAGGCAYAQSPGTKAMSFEAIGANLLDGLCQEHSDLTLDVIADELGSETRPSRPLSTNSKSGELFLISHSGKFIIKTISMHEAKALEEILPSYAEHLHGGGSVLGLYLGLYHLDLGGERRYFTIMHSVFDSPIRIDSMYDLKGSTYHRKVKDASESVRKDQDWIDDGRRLEVGEADAKSLLEMHRRDTDFLSSCQIIDFSVLVGIAELDGSEKPHNAWLSQDGSHCYFIGIVDVLIEYGMRKRLEHLLHKIKGVGETASVTDPRSYARRQQEFFRANVLSLPPEEKSSCGGKSAAI